MIATAAPTTTWYLVLAAVLFGVGTVGVPVRRNPLIMLMCVELMLNAVNLTFVALSKKLDDIGGQTTVFFVLVVAAADQGGRLALQLERLDLQILRLVDSEQHDDEQEQHHDRSGVDNDLYRSEEVCFLGHVHHGDPKQRQDEAERCVNRVRADDDPDRTAKDHQTGEDENEQLHYGALSSASRTP